MFNSLRTICLLLMLHVSVNSFSQGLVFGTVQDAFLKTPLPEAKVSLLLAADSTVIIDSIPITKKFRDDGYSACYISSATPSTPSTPRAAPKRGIAPCRTTSWRI